MDDWIAGTSVKVQISEVNNNKCNILILVKMESRLHVFAVAAIIIMGEYLVN